MGLFYPDILKNHIADITVPDLENLGAKALLLDVDNTLTHHGSQELSPEIESWLDEMRAHGFKMCIVSNAFEKRIAPFAKKLGLSYSAFSCKPFPFGFLRAAKRFGLKRRECVAIGDQVFTDILGAKIAGVHTIQVMPMHGPHTATLRLKRGLEGKVMKRYQKYLNKKGRDDG